jgi:hypothetical protein
MNVPFSPVLVPLCSPCYRSAADQVGDSLTLRPKATFRPEPAQIVQARYPISASSFSDSAHRAQEFSLNEVDVSS